MRWKITYADGRLYSLGYPTKSAAQAAARRLNVNEPPRPWPRFKVAEMTTADYEAMNDLEANL